MLTRTPLHPGQPPRRRKRIRAQSARARSAAREWRKVTAAWAVANGFSIRRGGAE